MEPTFVEREAFVLAGVVAHGRPQEMDFGQVWEQGYMPLNDQISQHSVDQAYYGAWMGTPDGIPDYIAGMAVPPEAPLPEGAARREIPAARYAVFECLVQTIGETYGYVYNQWLAASPYELDEGKADFEYYPPGCMSFDGPAAVYIPVRRKS